MTKGKDALLAWLLRILRKLELECLNKVALDDNLDRWSCAFNILSNHIFLTDDLTKYFLKSYKGEKKFDSEIEAINMIRKEQVGVVYVFLKEAGIKTFIGVAV